MSKPSKELLKSILIFSKLDDKEIELLQSISTLETFKDDNILFYEGDESKIIHMVISGKIEVYKVNTKGKEIVLKQFSPFSFIAEVSNYNNIKFLASSKSIGNSTVLLIEYEKFEKYFLYHSSIAPIILKSMANKVVILEKIISSNLIMDATQRVANFIYENKKCLNNTKHCKIAESLNISPVTFSRILKKFKEDKIIKCNKHNCIVDKNLLKKLLS